MRCARMLRGADVADFVYLDTSALMRWAAAVSGSPKDRDKRGQRKIESLIAGNDKLAGSPITVAEYTSVLYDFVRSQEEWASFFDASDADACTEQFMKWLADGSIAIRPLGRRAFEMGMAYVGMVAKQGRKMRGWDAIHLYEACRWAREVEQKVVLATSDKDFAKMIALFPEFGEYVDVVDVTIA